MVSHGWSTSCRVRLEFEVTRAAAEAFIPQSLSASGLWSLLLVRKNPMDATLVRKAPVHLVWVT